MTNVVKVEVQDHVAVITINRPEAMNAINQEVWQSIGQALEAIENDSDIYVAIITGEGKAFCAGADLKAVSRGEQIVPEGGDKWGFAGIAQHHISKPIIAAVNGFALGGGTEIALACDLVVADESATLGLPEVKRGLVAGAGGLIRLPRQIPQKVANYYILTGKRISIEEGVRWGLINEVAPAGQVVEVAKRLAQEIVENAPLAVSVSKEVIQHSLDATVNFPPTAWELSEQFMGKIMNSQDLIEGTRAFAEKRKPVWTGK